MRACSFGVAAAAGANHSPRAARPHPTGSRRAACSRRWRPPSSWVCCAAGCARCDPRSLRAIGRERGRSERALAHAIPPLDARAWTSSLHARIHHASLTLTPAPHPHARAARPQVPRDGGRGKQRGGADRGRQGRTRRRARGTAGRWRRRRGRGRRGQRGRGRQGAGRGDALQSDLAAPLHRLPAAAPPPRVAARRGPDAGGERVHGEGRVRVRVRTCALCVWVCASATLRAPPPPPSQIGYFNMLLAMTYNPWLLTAVVLGEVAGAALFELPGGGGGGHH